MSVKRWKLGWKRCDCVKCEAALTIEQTEEDCGWVRWGDHKDEVARLKSEVDALKLGSLLTAVDVLQFINLKAEVERLTAEVSYDNRVQLHVDKLAAEFTQSEVERLKAEVERLDTLCKQVMAQHSDISCENIMLRKAGDAMADRLMYQGYPATVPAWNAAKEGKQS